MERTEYTVHVCAECRHRHTDHAARPGPPSCSYDWCPCRIAAADVVANNPAEVRAMTPAPAMMSGGVE